MLKRIIASSGTICSVALAWTRGIADSDLIEGTRRSTMDELASATIEADKVFVFLIHAIETDFANQTTAAAIVTVPTSKPIKAIIGNSTDPIALLRDGQHYGYKMPVACASCDRRKVDEKWWRTQSKSNPSPWPNIPANREISRDIRGIGPHEAISNVNTRAKSQTCGKIPYATEQAIILEEKGIGTQD